MSELVLGSFLFLISLLLLAFLLLFLFCDVQGMAAVVAWALSVAKIPDVASVSLLPLLFRDAPLSAWYCCLGLYGTAESRIFHRTPAGHTAEKKMRRKRNRGCYGLLSVPRQPVSPLPLPPPTPRVYRTACGYVIRISWRETPPPSDSPPPSQAEFMWFSASSAKSEDGLYLETQKCYSWIRTAFVIMSYPGHSLCRTGSFFC